MHQLKSVVKAVETRNTVDHWEADTMIDIVHEKVIMTLVESKSVCSRVANVSHKSSVLVRNAVSQFLQAPGSVRQRNQDSARSQWFTSAVHC